MRVSNIIAVGSLLLLIMLLPGCGRKGPLYLQQVPEAPAAVVPATASPVPASAASATSPMSPNSTEPAKQP